MSYLEYLKQRLKDNDLKILGKEKLTDLEVYIENSSGESISIIQPYLTTINLSEIFKNKDFERIFVLPNICSLVYNNPVIPMKTQKILFFNWLILTLVDKEIDKKNSENINEDVKRIIEISNQQLSKSDKKIPKKYRNNLNKINNNLKSIETYSKYLSDLYKEYGMIVSREIHSTNHRDVENLASYLTNILVIQKLMDDLADWEDDYIKGVDTNITSTLESATKEEDNRKIITKKIKFIYLTQIVPSYIKQCINLYEDAKLKVDKKPLKMYLEREIEPTKRMQQLIKKLPVRTLYEKP